MQHFFRLTLLLLWHHLKPTFPLCLLQLSVISHDRWAWRHCLHPPTTTTTTEIPFPVSYFLSSSSAPSLLQPIPALTRLLAEGVKQGRGAQWLPAILLFWGKRIFFPLSSSSLTHPHSCSLARYRPTPTPPLSPSWAYSACSVTQQAERELSEGSSASVSSLSLQPPVLLLFTFLLGAFHSANILLHWIVFDSPEGTSLSFSLPSSSLFPSGSAVKSAFACVWRQTSEDADTSGCLQPPQLCGLFLLNAAGKPVIRCADGLRKKGVCAGVRMLLMDRWACWCWPEYVGDAVSAGVRWFHSVFASRWPSLLKQNLQIWPFDSGGVCQGLFTVWVLVLCVVCTWEFLPPCLLPHVCLPTCAYCASLNIHVCVFDLVFPNVYSTCSVHVIYSVSTVHYILSLLFTITFSHNRS